MSTHKNAVIAYIEQDRTLSGGRNLYNKLPQKNMAIQGSFTRMPTNETNIRKVCYELAKAVGLPERNLNILLQKPITKPELTTVNTDAKVAQDLLSVNDRLLLFTRETVDYKTAKAFIKELELKPVSNKKEDIYIALEDARVRLVDDKLFDLPENVKASIKLREQFPFLRESTCPDSLKLLVNELITAYDNFKTQQPNLHEALTEGDAAGIAANIVKNYIENKEAWNELEHYKANGTILGVHPMFERLQLKDDITALPTLDLVSKISNLKINIGKNSKKNNTDLVSRDTDLLAHAEAVLKSR
ncbi:hypothetical protein M1M27_gp47 [Cellulophaga phage Ingeline_1]|uniref:Uncharacterized protein n=1 Tax=Cellulophaga phage Ingeline_1 TaxID=2745674 RepID=A0A8E4ZBN4_9CAUD|nr:hypothetical protein M1M27_gp47 [Cellulophaga phage Ingeline_1]QQV90028.1 hypothetical protein Ingeline2_4 [Cellulophaga phage Ingeline_2]QQV90078.1 hypothetical protein Ingeline3_4 [Cellulophaga phage Ingeline_3]QQV90128.1 hypothetical protein Ingeline4_4 [Cellulophaga phage Ingeline_4]QQV90178.1 hypothetical protein Ingeline5_4 [Cellulophaga phage Ingeline_5]QQV90227.1 hypothetical protein Ingeline6_4 [Cellulophaga phage Ingeline_6]QQV90277.1 hypothetical protein Ingeline7_4 [Cellulophag